MTLQMSDGGTLTKILSPVPARRIPDEPVLEKRFSEPQTEVIALYRSRDYRQVEFGRGCPNCVLLAADIRPGQPNAVIVDVAVVSSTSSRHWFRCPAAFRCGVPEFSPLDQPRVSSCAGQRACRVWRLSDDNADAHDTIQITYKAETTSCRNCPSGMDYAAARKRWEEARVQAQRTCPVLPERPAQVLVKQKAQ